ncbi:MAG: TatD family hydrolase [Eubacterium sp.]|nr:TatD family hydrolase [Eubacterium sp.]
MKIFDTHAHYDDDRFDVDREFLLEGELGKGLEFEDVETAEIVNLTNIGCDMKTSRITDEFTKKYDYIYGAIGVIPHHVDEMTEADIDELRGMALSNKKIVAIGEIGLDYYYDSPPRDIQKKWFIRQMELAKELELPLVIHSREAAQDTLEIMKEIHAEDVGGVIHCYSYSEETAREFLKMGFFFGIGGVVTFKNSKKLKRAVQSIPLDNIVLETDCPYLTPSPYRGERNDSRYLSYVAAEIARLKDISVEEVAKTTFQNAMRLYNL